MYCWFCNSVLKFYFEMEITEEKYTKLFHIWSEAVLTLSTIFTWLISWKRVFISEINNIPVVIMQKHWQVLKHCYCLTTLSFISFLQQSYPSLLFPNNSFIHSLPYLHFHYRDCHNCYTNIFYIYIYIYTYIYIYCNRIIITLRFTYIGTFLHRIVLAFHRRRWNSPLIAT